MSKLKGCRPVQEINVEYSNLCTNYGAAQHHLKFRIPEDIATMEKRFAELQLELNEARKQEQSAKVKPIKPELVENALPDSLDEAHVAPPEAQL